MNRPVRAMFPGARVAGRIAGLARAGAAAVAQDKYERSIAEQIGQLTGLAAANRAQIEVG